MNDKKYPYIAKSKVSVTEILFTSRSFGVCLSTKGACYHDSWDENVFENITREYLANTYGKCESQEHADFICKLAEGCDIKIDDRYNENSKRIFFNFFTDSGELRLGFYNEVGATTLNEKLIHLPLPPKKEKPMEEAKPVYTKEMWERMELPQTNSQVLIHNDEGFKLKYGEDIIGKKVTVKSSFLSGEVTILAVEFDGDCYCFNIKMVKPIPTIEDELSNEFNKYLPLSVCKKYAQDLLAKYNITPKGE